MSIKRIRLMIFIFLLFNFLGCWDYPSWDAKQPLKQNEYVVYFECSNCHRQNYFVLPKGVIAKGKIVKCPICEVDTEINNY